MAELFDKLIQDGRVSFVPRSNKTRQFWTKYNAKVAGSQNAAKETVTWMPATEEEVAEWRKDAEPTSRNQALPAPAPVSSFALEELQKQMQLQQEQIKQQQEMITKLLESHVGGENSSEKERGKPGPKPKNNTNGEG